MSATRIEAQQRHARLVETDPPPEIGERLARFSRSQDPAELWPGLDEGARLAAVRRIEWVVRAVLAGARGVPLDAATDEEAYAIAIAGFTSGTGPLLARWSEDGRVALGARLLPRLAAQLEHARRRWERMERGVLPAFDALLARGITPIVLKGFHVARAYLDEPGVRQLADVDVAVPRRDIPDAEATLRALGWSAETDPYDPYKRDWLGPGVDPRTWSLERTDARGRWILEVHGSLDRRFDADVVARLDGEASCVEPLDIAGRPLLALAQPLLLIVLACQCSQELDSVRLLRLTELVHVIRADLARGRLHWDAMLAMLARTGTARLAWPALTLAEELAPGTVDARVLAVGRRESTPPARHVVARLTPGGGSFDRRAVLRQLMWVRGARPTIRRLWRLAWPNGVEGARLAWARRIRRLLAGGVTVRAPDERVVRPHPLPPPAPRADAP